MPTIRAFVQGQPRPQPRVRAFARQMGDQAVARVYDPGTAEAWKSQIALALRGQRERIDDAANVRMEFRFARPKSHSGKRGLRKSAPSEHTQKPDLDNLEKAVLDALTTLQVWSDDAQVTSVIKRKRWAAGDELAGLELEITY